MPRTPGQVLDNFAKLVDIIRKQNPRAVVLLSGVTPRYRNRRRQGRGNQDSLNEKVKHLCGENGLTYVGHPNFMSSGRVRQEFIACDGLHLRPAGQKQLASDIICALWVCTQPLNNPTRLPLITPTTPTTSTTSRVTYAQA
ncbi:uncharacterized protein LOC124277448 [Haliotis rubra]|uniref:uncharacterized protein LOC124277448 n=1 Tax=Haliotis rubra TaxID=36100 RepID=UPI001EE5D96E|nr:uncharacterized protein LOC124277448 [Haliotis rubra]